MIGGLEIIKMPRQDIVTPIVTAATMLQMQRLQDIGYFYDGEPVSGKAFVPHCMFI